MQQHGSKYFALRPKSLTLGIGLIGQISTFSEHGHVAYQIKGNQVSSNMVVNIFQAVLPLTPNTGPKGQCFTFSEHDHVAY